MLVDVFVRGNVFEFTASPTDVEGATVDPDSVMLHVSYLDADGIRVRADLPMEEATAGEWSANWDSSVSKKGRVDWAIRTENPSSAKEGSFQLAANLANPDPGENTG